MIEVKNLTKQYGDHFAVKDLSFAVDKGVYGFLGPNGAGKSTTMNIITGCLACTSGEVIINGFDIVKEPRKAKKYLGFLPEIPPVYPDLTPCEYLSFVGEAKGLRGTELKEQVASAMERTQITHMRDRMIKNLSKGYRQRVGLAQAIIGDPEIIILDEPTVGLDPKQIIEIRELIRALGEKHTVIISSHILSEISAICDRVIMIARGRLVAEGTLEELADRHLKSSTLELTVMGGEKNALEILGGISGAEAASASASQDADATDITVRCPIDRDIRRAVFEAFASRRMVILKMEHRIPSLEDMFLMLTDIPEEKEGENDDSGI